ncbi:MAG: hypothetical protein SH820_02815 [Xanthomonadales bacterium]|nr:hypothetical protein [Xanthomonadales bacterium]
MSEESAKRIIVVLGMHRSGTSAITRALTLLGVELGEDLYPAGFDNPTGFWEDQSVLEINDQLLACQGSGYVRLALAWEQFENEEEVSRLKSKATQLVSKKMIECKGIWGFKDPRTCRLLSFWAEIFQSLECKVSYVIALRNPVSVVVSLGERNNIPAERAYLLWLQHMLPAVLQTNDSDRVIVDYERLLNAPYEQLVRMSSSLNLPLPSRDSPSVREFENVFLQPHLCHSQFSLPELLRDNRAPVCVGSLYQLLALVASDQEVLDAIGVYDVLNKLKADLAAVVPIFNFVNFLEDEKASLLYSVTQREARIEHLNRKIAALNDAALQHDNQIAALNDAALQHDNQIAGLLNSRSWRLTKPLRYLWRRFL